MRLKKILKSITDFKVLFSLIGGIAISSGFPLLGNGIWFIIDGFWYHHYTKAKDEVSQVMFAAWMIIAGWGVVYWGLIV